MMMKNNHDMDLEFPALNQIIAHPITTTTLSYAIFFVVIKKSSLFSFLSGAARIDACSRVPSFINVGVCIYSAWAVFDDLAVSFWDLEAAAYNSAGSRDFYLHLCTGYMIYDLGLMMFTFKELGDSIMIVHHFVVIISLQLGVHYQAGTFYMTVLFFNEVSTIFVNCRFLLLHYGMGKSKVYYFNGVLLAATFFLMRIVTIVVLIGHVGCAWWFVAWGRGLWWTRPRSERYLFGGLTLLLIVHGALNMFWFSKIVQHVNRAAVSIKQKNQ